MKQDKQPEALRLAEIVKRYNAGVDSQAIAEDYAAAACELERQHAEIERLLAIKGAVFGVLEGHNIPHVTRKVLEQAYYCGVDVFADDAALAAQAKQGGV